MHILMIAAENGALPDGKVGGIGDVIRDVPRALARHGHQVSIITPGYQHLSSTTRATLQLGFSVSFRNRQESLTLHRVPNASSYSAQDNRGSSLLNDRPEAMGGSIQHWLLEHPLFAACGNGRIYCHDRHNPFATDASKFALFCLGVSHLLVTGSLPHPDFLHLHDWHTAPLLLLRKYLPDYRALQQIPTVYSIHNLSIQGVRPLAQDESSLVSWFGPADYELDLIRDPVYLHCINLMRTGINLADRIHIVSPHYAREVLSPSDPEQGFIGGEGLQDDLRRAHDTQRLHGILNGCDYPAQPHPLVDKRTFLWQVDDRLLDWAGNQPLISNAWFFAQRRLQTWALKTREDSIVLASIGRITWQKTGLLLLALPSGELALEQLLELIPDGILIMLGSGDSDYESILTSVMARHSNFIFLQGYSESLADSLYHFCDAFLMPSTFEPCGISQMLALRAGKPCLVHAVGGLADTVDETNGFIFSGHSPAEQAMAMLGAAQRMMTLRKDPLAWQKKAEAARSSRFSWDDTVQAYLSRLYTSGPAGIHPAHGEFQFTPKRRKVRSQNPRNT